MNWTWHGKAIQSPKKKYTKKEKPQIKAEVVEPKQKIWIIDYSFFIYNGSFAFKRDCQCLKGNPRPLPNCEKCEGTGKIYMQTSNGTITGGLFAVFKLAVEKAKEGYKIITVFDPPKEQLKRTELLDSYKGNRSETPEWIQFQMELGKTVLPYTKIDCYYSDHDESDDVMAAIAVKLADAGHYVVVASDDKDMFPLLAHKNIDLYRMRQMFTKESFHSHLLSKEKIVIADPGRFNEFLAVCGDAADNFNLLTGLGPKAAEWMIGNTKKSVIEVFDDLDSVPFKYQKKLVVCTRPDDVKKCPQKDSCTGCEYLNSTKRDALDLSLRIATLALDAEYYNINEPPDTERVLDTLKYLELSSIISNIDYLF